MGHPHCATLVSAPTLLMQSEGHGVTTRRVARNGGADDETIEAQADLGYSAVPNPLIGPNAP